MVVCKPSGVLGTRTLFATTFSALLCIHPADRRNVDPLLTEFYFFDDRFGSTLKSPFYSTFDCLGDPDIPVFSFLPVFQYLNCACAASRLWGLDLGIRMEE